ncbi:unnamed protein product [Ilex paraguariensis]|uniref:Uncharacterized protein n=1 Tax=Ilex paraguariensis TaxID=185542 RepID=A0ABC8SZZ7_9AQUA
MGGSKDELTKRWFIESCVVWVMGLEEVKAAEIQVSSIESKRTSMLKKWVQMLRTIYITHWRWSMQEKGYSLHIMEISHDVGKLFEGLSYRSDRKNGTIDGNIGYDGPKVDYDLGKLFEGLGYWSDEKNGIVDGNIGDNGPKAALEVCPIVELIPFVHPYTLKVHCKPQISSVLGNYEGGLFSSVVGESEEGFFDPIMGDYGKWEVYS